MDIGARVRERRQELDLSQEAVARRANVSTNLVNRVENGVTTDPHYSTLARLARALDVPVAALTEEEAVLPLVKAR